eukprot:TRINITY_DN2441_c0_g1_i1.p1 TRINITY_DN2441_c0_g1~~TRINITY_DN2441_c0_g1_i1.p1  ORF type:complete len:189 (-),score=24.67 TRINITY_DN2441_c0_g1_i1:97-639(-)
MFRKKHASQNLAPESPETEQDTDFDTGHFRTLSDFTNCYLCEKKLSKSSMKKNCYRCGMVFCQTCRGYERKLNSRGEPDDLGSLHKVCRKCYTQEQTIGAIREHEKHFKSRRRRISDMKSKDSDEKLKRLEDISKKDQKPEYPTGNQKLIQLRGREERDYLERPEAVLSLYCMPEKVQSD